MEAIKRFANDHPQITSWIILAIGMVIILVWSASDVGFTPGQWTALIITTILLAGACVWIIGWEDDEDDILLGQEDKEQNSSIQNTLPQQPANESTANEVKEAS